MSGDRWSLRKSRRDQHHDVFAPGEWEVRARGGKGRGVRVRGWLVSLAIVVAITVLATGNNPPKPNTASSLGALAAKIAIGVFLVAIAIRQRRRMGQPRKPAKWQEAFLDSLGMKNPSAWSYSEREWLYVGSARTHRATSRWT